MKTEQYFLLPLYPFNCDREVIKLKWGIRIMQASDDLRQHLSKLYTNYDDILRDTNKLKWMARFPLVGKSADDFMPNVSKGYTVPRMLEFAYVFVTGLRLHGKGLITPGPLVDAPTLESYQTHWLNASIRPGYGFRASKEPMRFELRDSDVPMINEILQDVYNWQQKRELDGMHVAIERFHFSYGGDPEEKLIDQMIAFEAIFLGDDKELAYKLSLRTAYLIGTDFEQRAAIFNNMKNAYGIRSNIVHGGEKVDMAYLSGILPTTENYLRESIRKVLSLLSNGHKFKEIRQHWFDNTILRGQIT